MSNPTPPITRNFYAIITNASGDKVLLIEEDNHWALPHWQASQAYNPGDIIPWILQTMRELTGLDTYSLRECYFQRIFENNEFRGTHRVIVLEAMGGKLTLENARWCDPDEIESKEFAIPVHAELVQQFLRENITGQTPPKRLPWTKPGWYKEVIVWATNFVEAQGWQLTAPIEQVKADTISSMLKLPTSVGNLYLKAVPRYFKNEPGFGQVLEKLLPGKVPHILTSEPRKGWILMEDFKGKPVATIKDFSVWENALREYARLQISCVGHNDELLQAGVRDRRLAVLGEQIEAGLSRHDMWLVGEPMGLSPEQVDQLHQSIPRLKAICQELAAFDLPETIDTGDFHAYNVAQTADGYVFYDWSDLTITHPFVSLNPFVDYDKTFEGMANYWENLTRAYLEPWQEFLPSAELEKAYQLGFILGSAIQILNYQWIQANLELEDHPNTQYGLVHFAKMLLSAL